LYDSHFTREGIAATFYTSNSGLATYNAIYSTGKLNKCLKEAMDVAAYD
jgi:hypothetical protein